MEHLVKYCKELSIPFRLNFDIKHETYFKRGGIVKVYIQPQNAKQLEMLVVFLGGKEVPFKILGGTTNVFLLDSENYNVIISTKNMIELNNHIEYIEVESGYMLSDLIRVLLINGVQGFEGLEGIPGTIGGAIFMNAGAYGYEVSDHLLEVKCINNKGEVFVLSKDECKFSFRNSLFKEDSENFILSAKFDTTKKGNREEIANKMEVYHIARHSYQEFSYPNLGSMFSTRGDMYKEILSKSFEQKALFWLLKILLKNPISKFIYRKKPTNNRFNLLVNKYYSVNHPLSHKSINILINTGEVDDYSIIEHTVKMKELFKSETSIENEIYIENDLK
ncbi:TPA: UDP-N-acetylmuramate dehydrogenase [Vibrio campbellii]